MTDPDTLIHAPLGVPGSGRVRYGAAMALYQAGRLSPAQLEVYREMAAHDGRDPALVLAERGLPRVSAAGDAGLVALFDQAVTYLNHLDHPGAEEVRAGLARATGTAPGLVRGQTDAPNPVADRWLAPALACLAAPHQPLARAIAVAAPHLAWVTYDAYPRDRIGEGFASGHAYALILGHDAPFAASDFDMGLFLIAPHVLYRDHAHAAPELYAPLTGPHGWRFGPGLPLIVKHAHQPVWNPPFRPHLTKVGAQPFLALFVWTRDVDQPARVLAADDWPELEGVRLG